MEFMRVELDRHHGRRMDDTIRRLKYTRRELNKTLISLAKQLVRVDHLTTRPKAKWRVAPHLRSLNLLAGLAMFCKAT